MSATGSSALVEYRTAMRRQRVVYYSIIAAVVVALVITVSVAWSRGEVANTTLHTVDAAPQSLALAATATAPSDAWHTSDHAALGAPLYSGTVVTYDAHTVRGRDARTGVQTWSYYRSNRTVCAALQAAGTTIAVYEVGGNCDELTALGTSTGHRRWTRTLDENGQPLYGHPTYQVLSYTIMITTPSVIYAIDPGSGIDHWTYRRYGCSIRHATLGSDGALISQTCTNPRCKGKKFCGRGTQLLLRDGVAGVNDKSADNPDVIKWNLLGNTDVPVSAGSVISAVNPTTRSLDTYAVGNGQSAGVLQLRPTPSTLSPITAVDAGTAEFISIGDITAVVGQDVGRTDWTRTTASPPTVVPLTEDGSLTVNTARVTVAASGGAAVLDAVSGLPRQQVTLTPAPAAGSLVYPLGSGQLVAGPTGTVAYL